MRCSASLSESSFLKLNGGSLRGRMCALMVMEPTRCGEIIRGTCWWHSPLINAFPCLEDILLRCSPMWTRTVEVGGRVGTAYKQVFVVELAGSNRLCKRFFCSSDLDVQHACFSGYLLSLRPLLHHCPVPLNNTSPHAS